MEESTSPLLAACRQGDRATEAVQMMLDHQFSHPWPISKAEPTTVEKFGLIQAVASAGSISLLRFFAARGYNLCNLYYASDYYLPVYHAMVACRYKALEFLLQERLYPPWTSEPGMELLASLGRRATAKSMSLFLIYTGLSVNRHYAQAGSVFSNVIRYSKDHKLAEFLISKGANVNEPNVNGRSVIFYRSIRRLSLLIDAGVNMSMRGPQVITPLMMAAQQQRGYKYVKAILESGIDGIDVPNDDQETALKLGVTQGDIKTVQLLLRRLSLLIDAGADVNVLGENGEGQSRLIHAVIHGRRLSAQLLLEHGADTEVRDKRGSGIRDYLSRHTPSAAIR
ncbi:hypothetical protein NLG97_g7226 [Lecanicillium saksenae]|uniref:Uncharacterized protein n=1 Tax=Lecanicillium saksenae TaxID=468837 RepID=A0ACC1QP86_9HYPO|nr:hypothetical protein NLG97_g7226 [Lecanicillium saksenae]